MFRSTSLVLLCLCAFASTVRAGAWLQETGASYAKLAYLNLRADSRLGVSGPAGQVSEFGGEYAEHQLFFYGEWGVHPRFTAIGSFAVKDAQIVDSSVPDFGTRSTGDLRGGVRYGVARGDWPVAIESILSLPTYSGDPPSTPTSAREQFVPVGTGEVELELRVQAGRSLHPLPLYVNLDAGRRFRGGAFGDPWLVNLEVGAVVDRFFLKSDLRAEIADGDIDVDGSAGAVTVREDALRWAPELSVELVDGWWLGAGAFFLLDGENTLDGTQYTLSLAWERRTARAGG